jgi:hypothetical protein
MDVENDDYSYENVSMHLVEKWKVFLRKDDCRFAATILLANHLLINFIGRSILHDTYSQSHKVFRLLWIKEIEPVVSSEEHSTWGAPWKAPHPKID